MSNRKYWIKQGDFSNVYSLCYTTSPEEEKLAKELGYERITYKQAVQKCVQERDRRRTNPSFAYYGDILIYPLKGDAKLGVYGLPVTVNTYVVLKKE